MLTVFSTFIQFALSKLHWLIFFFCLRLQELLKCVFNVLKPSQSTCSLLNIRRNFLSLIFQSGFTRFCSHFRILLKKVEAGKRNKKRPRVWVHFLFPFSVFFCLGGEVELHKRSGTRTFLKMNLCKLNNKPG